MKVERKKIKELSKNGIAICDILETVIRVLDAELINRIYDKDNTPHPHITGEQVQA